MNAVVYVRVSTDEQVQGTSLDSQTKACLDYAKSKGFKPKQENIFREEGESAKFANRPELLNMLRYCKDNKGSVSHCIVWKVDRLARDIAVHTAIKASLAKCGVKLLSVTEPINDDPMGKAMEGMLAVFAQLDNDVRTVRTTEGMIARTEQGGWVHDAPPGYDKDKTPSGVPTLKPNDLSSNVTKLLTLYGKGGYTVAQAVDLAYDLGIRTKEGKQKSWQSIRNILGNPLYAGFINTKFTDGRTIKGLHQPLITEEVYSRINNVLQGVDHNFSKHAESDWVLRGGFLRHTECQHPLTGSAPTGRSGPSPRYHCTKCKAKDINRPVSKKRDDVHNEFMQLLSDVRPDEGTAKLFKEIVLRRWNNAYKESRELSKNIHNELETAKTRKSNLTDMYLDNKIDDVEYKSKKEELEDSIQRLSLRFADANSETSDKERIVDEALLFMTNPGLYWNQAPLEIQKRIQHSIFPNGLEYDCKDGFGTIEIAESYQLVKKIASEEANNPILVHPDGFEPPTLCSEDRCSIQLSYGCKIDV